MTAKGIFRCVIVTGIFCGLFAGGCEEQAKTGQAEVKSSAQSPKLINGQVKIALKPTVGGLDKYNITTLSRRITKWQGPVPEKTAFDESVSEERVEMAITRRIQTVDTNGVATAKVSIDKLKCVFMSKGQTTLDFDSTRAADSNNPLIKLIGATYIIEFNPRNIVSSVDDLPPVAAMMKGDSVAEKQGSAMVLPESIIERHSTMRLPLPGQDMLKPGGKWSVIKTFLFGKMGIKSYEKIYTLKELRNDGREIAVIDMNAIPTSEVEPQYAGKKAEMGASQKFDSKETYTGVGEFDVKAGRIENYHENLLATWTVAIPAKQGDTVSEPVVLNMTAERGYGIERIK